jgi:hypothetical protein
MLSTLLAFAIAAQADATVTTRQAYSACLREFLTRSMERRMAPAAFEAAIAGQCADRATAFREALVQRDQRAGGGRQRAEQDARTTMEDMRANFVERYRDEMDASAPPRPEPAAEPEPEPEAEAPETPDL